MASSVPFPAYTYVVYLQSASTPRQAFGGFSNVSGLVPSGPKTVTFRRGLVSANLLWTWMASARGGGAGARRTATVTLRDQANNPVQTWLLQGCLPQSYTGPTLSVKAGADVAMEELVLTMEGFTLAPPQG